MKAVLPAIARPLLEPGLPADLAVSWFTSAAEAKAAIPEAEIAWVDMNSPGLTGEIVLAAGPTLRWLSTLRAGLDGFPIAQLREHGVTVTSGTGINAQAVAEYAVMGVLAAAKRFDQVVRAHDRHEWLRDAPGKRELADTRALVVGFGTIGRLIGRQLAAFDVAVTGVTRSGRDGTLTPDAWCSPRPRPGTPRR